MTTQLEQAWELAKQRFAAVGIDVEEALRQLDRLPVSMHCWQGDDVSGFENPEGLHLKRRQFYEHTHWHVQHDPTK